MIAISTFTQPRIHASSAVSMPGFIGLYFGLRVCLTFLFFRADPQAGSTVSVALNLLLIIPAVLYAIGPVATPLRESLRIWPFRLVLAYLALALISLTWSETSSRSVALGYWATMAADVLLVLLVLHAEPAAQATESLLKGLVYGTFLLAIVAWATPGTADLRLGNNEFLNPNAIGFECAFATLLCQYFAPQGARWKWLGTALALTLIRSLSKTSIIAFVIVEAFFLVRTRTISRVTKIALTFAFLLVIAIFWNLFASYYTLYVNDSTQAETLSGRVGIWIVTLGFALDEPWLGHGMHSFRTVIPAFGLFEPWHAHNEFLHQFFVYGLTGVALVATLYATLFVQARKLAENPLALLTRSFLLLVLIRGLADTERFDISFPLWAVTAISITLAQKQEAAS